jgi:rhodanese-related sulfurtransferase
MNASPLNTISASETQARRGAALLLDVRTPAEYTEVHIDGAVLHPLTELNPEFVRTQTQGSRECIVICKSGGRASKAAEALVNAGLPNVRVMEGGMTAWCSLGLPSVAGKKTISLERQVRIAGLVFAGVTDTCGMGMVLARMPWNTKGGSATGPSTQSGQSKPSCCSR